MRHFTFTILFFQLIPLFSSSQNNNQNPASHAVYNVYSFAILDTAVANKLCKATYRVDINLSTYSGYESINSKGDSAFSNSRIWIMCYLSQKNLEYGWIDTVLVPFSAILKSKPNNHKKIIIEFPAYDSLEKKTIKIINNKYLIFYSGDKKMKSKIIVSNSEFPEAFDLWKN